MIHPHDGGNFGKSLKYIFLVNRSKNYFKHSTAIVDDDTKIGTGTKIWHFCHIMKNASIGNNCILGQNCFVGNNVQVGNGVKVQNNVSIYSGVIVEDHVFIGPSAVFTNVNKPRAFIEQKDNFLSTRIGIGATIGANATIVCGNNIGSYAFIGAGTLINKHVPDFALVLGVPGKVVGYVSRSAHRLDFDSTGKAQCPQSGEWYELSQGKVQYLESI